jgi:hypothetical protein
MEVCSDTGAGMKFIWNQMDKAVRELVGRVHVAQETFPINRREQACYRSLSIELYL